MKTVVTCWTLLILAMASVVFDIPSALGFAVYDGVIVEPEKR
jgi:hypothetical protein